MNKLFKGLLTGVVGSLLAGFGSLAVSAEGTATVTVQVSGLAESAGSIYIAVYDSSDAWLGPDTVLERQVVIADALAGEVVSTDLELPPGDYALSIFYDRNGNGDLDTNFIGIPKEPIAMSNNATGKYGPPKYKDAVFSLGTQPVLQAIEMAEL